LWSRGCLKEKSCAALISLHCGRSGGTECCAEEGED
jgi:hypothetical protein